MMRSEETTTIANVRVGRPDVKPTAPSHVRGVYQGNRHHPPEGTARRSTGIRATDHDVIDPRMPRLSPP